MIYKILFLAIFSQTINVFAEEKQHSKMNCDSTCLIPQNTNVNHINISVTDKEIGVFTWGPKCGASAGSILPNKPDSFLCDNGSASSVSTINSDGETLYSWTCSTNNGKQSLCNAEKREIGMCGTSHGQSISSNPTNLCATGSSSGFVFTGSEYKWFCQGNYGSKSSCSANYKPPIPVCSIVGYGPEYPVTVIIGYREVSYPTILVCGESRYYCEPIYQQQMRSDPIYECN